MNLNRKLYEINTRVWIKKFNDNAKLSDIPDGYFEDIASKGINYIWLMGIWKTCKDLIPKYCFEPDLVSSYSKSLKDWKKNDVIGSPFSIDEYAVDPSLGNFEDLKLLKEKLNSLGLKLILDFIPNHFGASTKLLHTKPDLFLQGNEEHLKTDPFTFFKFSEKNELIFAHGRDPLFPAWTDTVQVDYSNDDTRIFMTNQLLKLAEICDGVRCDMAMLPLNNVFANTWAGVLKNENCMKNKTEFWLDTISEVKQKSPEFIFIAEAYWDLEWQLQQLGFDFTYDKRLLDRLDSDDFQGVREHLCADYEYQNKSVRFIENHDELRAVTKFGKYKSLASAVVMSTIQGLKLYYDGQFEGKKIRLPVQLGREPFEKESKTTKDFYAVLLEITKAEIFVKGNWTLLYPSNTGAGDDTNKNIFAWQWKLKNENRLVVINYAETTSRCRLKFDINSNSSNVILVDLLTGDDYSRSIKEINGLGLFIELKSFHSHIFAFSD